MKREENNPVSSQASTSQEENLLQENSDLHRGSDPQSTGSEISESSHLTTMSSTEEIEVPLESLGAPEEQNDTLGMMPWEEERESCLQHIALLSKEMNKLKLEIKCVSERKTPLPQSFPVVWKKCRKALKDNLQIEDKCEELNVLMKINIELKVALEKQAQRLEEIQNNHKRLQAQRSEILLAHAEGTVTPKPSLWRRFILSFKCEWTNDACVNEVWVWMSQWSCVSGCLTRGSDWVSWVEWLWHLVCGGTNSRPISGQQNHSPSSAKDSRLICSDYRRWCAAASFLWQMYLL